MSNVWVNANGEVISPLELTEEERRHIALINELKYPDDKEVLRHLSWHSFHVWLYGMNPQEALLRIIEIKPLMDEQKNKMWYHRISDSLWRWWNGVAI